MMDDSKLARRAWFVRNRHELIGGLILLVIIAGMICVLLDCLDAEASRQITLAMIARG